ncbi:PREDICTED: uncharacterized protein LOC108752400 [Trachymyrmex septentrionalis]|uniref:uncharacterized protein LOC108752400 n=1 Tax=Trachymyrmex septentrionalis TaxID=34720 RepID=UPI00084F0C14|nr:PREDICTED: uncharacterized protein LOC108752400 [Trachymyrmex septentrionalis]
MSHPSRLKQPKHRYLMQKLRVVEATKWDRPFRKSKEYWKKFCDDEEKRLIRVRNSFPKSSYLPIIPILRDFKTDVRDITDSSIPRRFDENVLLVDSKSFEAPDISSTRDENFISNAREPIVKISPPTPKKPSKNDAITIARTNAEEQHTLVTIQNKSRIKKVDSYKEPESLDVSSKNSIIPHDGLRDGRIYSKRTCPFHRYEPVVKIFDDDIKRYLTEDPRANVSLGEKLNKLPHVQDASKYDKDKNRITSIESKKIKRITVPQKTLEYYLDNAVDLSDTSGTTEVKSKNKKNYILDKQYNFRSDVYTSKFKFSSGKTKSTKEIKSMDGLKIASSFPKSFQPRNRVKRTSSKVINQSSNLQTLKIREKLIDKSE